LLHLQLGDVRHLAIFIDHLLNNVVNLIFFLKVFVVSLFFKSLGFVNLNLDSGLVGSELGKLLGVAFSLDHVLSLFLSELVLFHSGVVFLKDQQEILTKSIWRLYWASVICAERSLLR
jgi:hypothetical protein